ncbi:unnamed protein product [Cunninghamella blakesleeana]
MWFSDRFMTLLSKTLNSIQPTNENQLKNQQDIIIGIIGSANVGKTALIHNGLDTVISYPVTSSIRQHSSTITVNNKQKSILILETNNLKDLTTLVHAIFICYDITQQSSIDMVPDILKHVRSQKIPSYLFGLKEDLSILRQVDTTIGDQLSKSFNIPFYELNSFQSNDIHLLFHSILNQCTSKEQISHPESSMIPSSSFINHPIHSHYPLDVNDHAIHPNATTTSTATDSMISTNSHLQPHQYGFVYAPTSGYQSSIQPFVYDSSFTPSQIQFLQKRRGSKDSCESSSTGLTVDSIIDRLIGYDNINEDDQIIPVFIIFFRKFMKPSELVKILIERFEHDISLSLLPTPLQKRIITIFITWLSEYWNDFINKKTRHCLNQFIKKLQQMETMKSSSSFYLLLENLYYLINQSPPNYDPDCTWGQTDIVNVNDSEVTHHFKDKQKKPLENNYTTYFDFQSDFMLKYLDDQHHPHSTTTMIIDPSRRSSLSSTSYPTLSSSSYVSRDSLVTNTNHPHHSHNNNQRLSFLSSSSSSSSALPSYSLSIPPYSSSSEMTTISDSIYGSLSPPSAISLPLIHKQQQQPSPPPASKISSTHQTSSPIQLKSFQQNNHSMNNTNNTNNNNNSNKTTQPEYGGGLILLNNHLESTTIQNDKYSNKDLNSHYNDDQLLFIHTNIPQSNSMFASSTISSNSSFITSSSSVASTSSSISSTSSSSFSSTAIPSLTNLFTTTNVITNHQHPISNKSKHSLSLTSLPHSTTSSPNNNNNNNINVINKRSLVNASTSTSVLFNPSKNNNNDYNNNNNGSTSTITPMNYPLFLSTSTVTTITSPLPPSSSSFSSSITINKKKKQSRKQKKIIKKINHSSSSSLSSNHKHHFMTKWFSLDSFHLLSSSSSTTLNHHPYEKIIKNDTNILLSISSQYLAEQLTWIESELFGKIKSREFIRMLWSYPNDQIKKSLMSSILKEDDDDEVKDLSNTCTSALQASISHFNFISAWVISMIVLQPKLKKRVALLEKFMVIAVALRNQNNYNTLMAILAGINNTSVLRLKQTQQFIVKKKIYKKFQSLEKLMSSHRSYCSYRLALKQSSSPCIPYLGIHNQDLIALAEANKDVKSDGTIHWEKFKLMGDCIMSVMKYQKHQHHFTPNGMIQKWLSRTVILSDEEQYQQSILIEPRIKSINSMNQLKDRLFQL